MNDMVLAGRQNKVRGEKQGSCKLTETQARIIKYSKGQISAKELSQHFNVSIGHINKLRRGDVWGWL